MLHTCGKDLNWDVTGGELGTLGLKTACVDKPPASLDAKLISSWLWLPCAQPRVSWMMVCFANAC